MENVAGVKKKSKRKENRYGRQEAVWMFNQEYCWVLSSGSCGN